MSFICSCVYPFPPCMYSTSYSVFPNITHLFLQYIFHHQVRRWIVKQSWVCLSVSYCQYTDTQFHTDALWLPAFVMKVTQREVTLSGSMLWTQWNTLVLCSILTDHPCEGRIDSVSPLMHNFSFYLRTLWVKVYAYLVCVHVFSPL